MRKYLFGALLVAALAVPTAAVAANLHGPHKNTGCAGYYGDYHFVNNQHGGLKTPGYLVATFEGGNVVAWADKVNNGTQHWTIEGPGLLIDANSYVSVGGAQIPGKLVLSDYTCTSKKIPS